MAEEVCYGLAQEYLFNVGLKMGTFPKRSDDHKLLVVFRLISHSGEGRRNDDPARIAAAIDLFDQLRSRLPSGFSIARINSDDLRVQEFYQRCVPDACQLQRLNTLLL